MKTFRVEHSNGVTIVEGLDATEVRQRCEGKGADIYDVRECSCDCHTGDAGKTTPQSHKV